MQTTAGTTAVDISSIGEIEIETIDFVMVMKRTSEGFIRQVKWKLNGALGEWKEASAEYVNDMVNRHKEGIRSARHIEDCA
jgi:hypothetical protein